MFPALKYEDDETESRSEERMAAMSNTHNLRGGSSDQEKDD